METASFWKKPLYSALIFFGILIMLSVGYATYQTITAGEYASGQPLTQSLFGKVVSNLDDLNTRVTTLANKACPSGMTKITDFCIDNTSTSDAAGEDQKMAMIRCSGQGKRLCDFGEIKTSWLVNTSLICPGWIWRYSTSEIFAEWSNREMTVFDCQNCPSSGNNCIWAEVINTDSTDKSFCCLNP